MFRAPDPQHRGYIWGMDHDELRNPPAGYDPRHGNWEYRLHAELAPAPDDTMPWAPAVPGPEPAEGAVMPYPPRPEQVVKALMHVAGMVDVWTHRGELTRLDAYLTTRHPKHVHPYGGLRQNQSINNVVMDAADMLRLPWSGQPT